VPIRRRVAVYVERESDLLVFEHRDHPEAGRQIPAGGLEPGEPPEAGALREVFEETGLRLSAAPSLLGTHDHPDGLGRPSRTYFFKVYAPPDAPDAWEHRVTGEGDDNDLVFLCRFDPAPTLWPVQAVFRPGANIRSAD
jgi:8-oxo-dGTP pyrophosphatase MutT (NUDIX family)